MARARPLARRCAIPRSPRPATTSMSSAPARTVSRCLLLERQPHAQVRAARAWRLDHFNAAPVRHDVFPDDRQSEAGAFDRPRALSPALIIRLENARAVGSGNAGPLVDDIDV